MPYYNTLTNLHSEKKSPWFCCKKLRKDVAEEKQGGLEIDPTLVPTKWFCSQGYCSGGERSCFCHLKTYSATGKESPSPAFMEVSSNSHSIPSLQGASFTDVLKWLFLWDWRPGQMRTLHLNHHNEERKVSKGCCYHQDSGGDKATAQCPSNISRKFLAPVLMIAALKSDRKSTTLELQLRPHGQ